MSTSFRRDSGRKADVAEPPHVWWNRASRATAAALLLGLVLWLLAAGRWGSYLGYPQRQVYITEIMLALVAVLLVSSQGWRQLPAVRPPVAFVLPLMFLVAWAIVRTVTGLSHGLVAIRDFAPYGYAVVAALAITARIPRRWIYGLAAAAAFHALWVSPLLWDASFYAAVEYPLGKTRYFQLRTDFDALSAGVLGCACLLVAVRRSAPVDRLVFGVLAVWSGTLVLLINNRAGLLSAAVALAWCAVHLGSRHTRQRHLTMAQRRRLVAGVLLAVVTGMAVVLAFTPAGQRLTETFDVGGSRMENLTTSARLTVYGKVLDYVTESPARTAVGVGMGPDFLAAADATGDYDPGGTLGVRSPHNFLLGTFARLGIIGAVAHLAVVALGYLMAWRIARLPEPDTAGQLASLLLVALPVAAAVGVVLESPFGAVPYFWAYGVALVVLFRRGGQAT